MPLDYLHEQVHSLNQQAFLPSFVFAYLEKAGHFDRSQKWATTARITTITLLLVRRKIQWSTPIGHTLSKFHIRLRTYTHVPTQKNTERKSARGRGVRWCVRDDDSSPKSRPPPAVFIHPSIAIVISRYPRPPPPPPPPPPHPPAWSGLPSLLSSEKGVKGGQPGGPATEVGSERIGAYVGPISRMGRDMLCTPGPDWAGFLSSLTATHHLPARLAR